MGGRSSRVWKCLFRVVFTVLYVVLCSFLGSLVYILNELDSLDKLGVDARPHSFAGAENTQSYIDRGARHGGRRPILPSDLRVGKLTCDGLTAAQVKEMVYWQEIPEDNEYRSPFYKNDKRQYLTFAMDEGGFNNIRMSYETVMALSLAMGRTMVLPPEQQIYLLYHHEGGQRRQFGFGDFFPVDDIVASTAGLEIITTEEFLTKEGLAGNLRNKMTGEVSFPPNNRTNWDGDEKAVAGQLQPWLETVSFVPEWNPEECVAAFPSNESQTVNLGLKFKGVKNIGGFPSYETYIGNPTSVHASSMERLAESLNGREKLCIYNESSRDLIHFHGKQELGGRLLVHFYSFLFFEEWKQDLWTKRFVRDKVRYTDEIQCAAARIVAALKESSPNGEYDAFHVRRGEFQYKRTRVSAQEMYDISNDQIPNNATVYIATDERNKRFFDDLGEHYNLKFLDDFRHLLGDVNSNHYGMIDQLVASKSRTFFGCWFSTFSSYINRLRGCRFQLPRFLAKLTPFTHADHNDLLKGDGFAKGLVDSYYYALPDKKLRMREYWPISGAVYAREFPTAWRNIDH